MKTTRILWADDQMDVAHTLAALLAPLHAEIVFTPDGTTAAEALSLGAFDLVVADLAMPPGEWGGLWLLEQMSSLGSQIPVVVLSGEGSQAETIKALRLGAWDYVTKEAARIDFLTQITAVLEKEAAVRASISELIDAGESARVEFKQTARVNLTTKQTDPVIELMVIKSVAAFMNSLGGTLLLGVTDVGAVFGIEKDMKTLGGKQNRDGFELWLTGLLDNRMGATATSNVSISFEAFSEGTVCRVDVHPTEKPLFVRGKKGEADLYVRLNNSTRLLNTAEALEYVRSHWR